jgi:hypothetical protein
MDPTGQTARRFPLIARPRPPCLPLPARVEALTDLAAQAQREEYHGIASSVYNQAALLASDLGLADLARQWCHRHATTYLNACPLNGIDAIRALEPVVNLARLRIRDGLEDDGHRLLISLNQVVTSGRTGDFDGITVPANLTATDSDRQEVRQWLWRVIVADGTRALTTAGRWQAALGHLQQHHGIGQRMLDGRQVAVLARATASDYDQAQQLLAGTTPGEPWENAVTACLTALCQPPDWRPGALDLDVLSAIVSDLDCQPGLSVFRTRLFLTVVDAARDADHPATRTQASALADWIGQIQDGYAAREILSHVDCARLLTAQQTSCLTSTVKSCALGSQTMPPKYHADLCAALDSSEALIVQTLASSAEAPSARLRRS